MDEQTVKRLIDEARAGDADRLRESEATIKRLETQLVREAARNEAGRILESVADMHPKAKAEVIRNVSQNPPVKEGALDHDAFAALVDTETKRVAAVFAEVAGTKPVTGAGAEPITESGNPDDIRKQLAAEYRKGGMSEAAANQAAGVVQ